MAIDFADTSSIVGCAYDAVQLSAATEIRFRQHLVILISADDALNLAARVEGFPVENPNDHP